MLWQMACTGRQWCDFVSYDPRLPDDLQLFVHRFDRDEKRIEEIEEEVLMFLFEVNEMICKIKEQEQMKAPPPSKELCLLMAKITYPRDEKLSWTWLFAWGFHDAYVEGWYEGVKL